MQSRSSDSIQGSYYKCILCLDAFENGDNVVFLPCKAAFIEQDAGRRSTLGLVKNQVGNLDGDHFMHYDCLVHFLKDSARCPVCQVQVKKQIFENVTVADFGLYRDFNDMKDKNNDDV